ncbi:MAG: hypothetical protein IPL46_34710 [Saprospiraceae bacterium]|nr:hypothetical protein [Saprospiraceae bacterium]
MNKRFLTFVSLLLFVFNQSHAQWQKKEQRGKVDIAALNLQPIVMDQSPNTRTQRFKGVLHYQAIPGAILSLDPGVNVRIKMTNAGGSIWAEGNLTSNSSSRDLDRSAQRNVMIKHALVKSGYPADLTLQEMARSQEKSWEHYKMQHMVEGIPVWANELTLHVKDQDFSANGSPFKGDFRAEESCGNPIAS